MDSYTERRRHRRVHIRMPVRISTIEPERDPWTGRPFFRATRDLCANLSRGGAFIQTDEPLRPGRRVLLELALPGGQQVEAIGRVAWSKRVMAPRESDRESGIGIEFLGAAADEFAVLADYISHLGDGADGDDADRDFDSDGPPREA